MPETRFFFTKQELKTFTGNFSIISKQVKTKYGYTHCQIYNPINEDGTLKSNSNEKCMLMIHGLGCSSRRWYESDIPACIASETGITVVCFDLYSHGKSTVLNADKIKHKPILFLEQIADLLKHQDLPLKDAKELILQGFSFGGFLLFNFLDLYYKAYFNYYAHLNYSEEESKSDKISSPITYNPNQRISKVIFQSPWNGHVPFPFRALMRVPGLLRLLRPIPMKYIRSIKALKYILLNSDQNKKLNYVSMINRVTANIIKFNKEKTKEKKYSNKNNKLEPINLNEGNKEEIEEKEEKNDEKEIFINNEGDNTEEKDLIDNVGEDDKFLPPEIYFISGKVELYFYITVKRAYKRLKKINDREHYDKKICDSADHLTFIDDVDGFVGDFYRSNIIDFIKRK